MSEKKQGVWIMEREAHYLARKIDCLVADLMSFKLPLSISDHERLARLSRIADKAHQRAERRFYKAYLKC